MVQIPEPTELLSDGRVSLRLAAERDIPEILIAYEDDPQLHLRLGEDRPPSGAELGRRAEHAADARKQGTSVTWTITAPGTEICVGQLYAQRFDWDHARAELGIWLALQVRGQGLAPRALELAADWLFASCRLERLQLLTHPENQPMLRSATAAGFVTEGVLRGYERAGDQRVDVAILSLLPSDR